MNYSNSDIEQPEGFPSVLVVEDDEGLNRIICKTLQRQDFTTESALNAHDTIDKIHKSQVVVMLLDYMLPDMNGMQLIQSLAKQGFNVPFIVMTGHGDQKIAVEMMKQGAREYLVKDTDFMEHLPQAVKRVLKQIETEQYLEETRAEKAKLEVQLRQAQKMEAVGVLAGGVAHDFNNLLTAIHGYTSLALSDIDPQSKLYAQLGHVKQCAERASSLTRQLLLFSRKEIAELCIVKINNVVTDILKMLSRLIGEDVKIVTELSQELRTVNADVGNLEQIIMNLAVNARDAMPNGGTVTISTKNVSLSQSDCAAVPKAKPGEYVCLQISDTGLGMNGETQEHIFEPFFTTKKSGKGTGLGLAVVYGIIQQHNGLVHVYSEVGMGTTFKIYLPAAKGDIADRKFEDNGLAELKGNNEGILVVEDNKEIRELCTVALDENGYKVFEAVDGRDGVEIFKKNSDSISLVISDVVMPQKSGIKLAEELKSFRPDVKLILSSGYTGERSNWEKIKERGYKFLQKPYTMTELLRAVKNCLKEDNEDQ